MIIQYIIYIDNLSNLLKDRFFYTIKDHAGFEVSQIEQV